jgi:hypothetical protein
MHTYYLLSVMQSLLLNYVSDEVAVKDGSVSNWNQMVYILVM